MAKSQLNVRLEPALRVKLEAWVDDLNRGRRVPLNLSDLVRGLLDWGADERPDFESKGEPSKS